jgi:glycosyltransferase involved in cell wall biosynthesis
MIRSTVEPLLDADYPVVVVDDGSSDGTSQEATKAGAALVRHPENAGKGAALRSGFREAIRLGAVAAVTVDADGQHLADEALRLALSAEPRESLVLGVRDLVRDGAPRPNRFSNGISNFFLSLFSGRTLHDTQCGLRRYPLPESLALGAVDDGYAFEAEFVLRAARAGWRIAEIPIRVHYPPESERTTHFHSAKDPARIVYRVVATLGERMRAG